MRRLRPLFSLLLVCALLVAGVQPLFAAPAAALPVAPQQEPGAGVDSAYRYGQCSAADRQSVRSEIEAAALAALTAETSPLDIDDLVRRKWAEVGADAVVDAEIQRAVQEVAVEESYWQRLWSAWSSDKAEEFADRIASSAFGSPAFAAMIENLSTAIGLEIAANVEAELDRAASAALLCLRDYAGAAYGATLLNAFEQSVSTDIVNAEMAQMGDDFALNPIDQHATGLTGAGVIVATEVSRRVALKLSEKIAGRVAGKVTTRILGRIGTGFIPIAGWVVGIGMIAWDLYQGGKGALPQIEEALTSEDVKQRIRDDVADAVRVGLPEEAAIAALETSVSMVEQWDNFCVQYGELCTLANENASFRALLDGAQLADLGRLSGLVRIFVNEIGRNDLNRALETGDFDDLLALPDSALTILRESGSVTTTLAWAELAGDRLDDVASIGVHSALAPADLTRDELTRLLGLTSAQGEPDPLLIVKVLAQSIEDIHLLLALPPETLAQLTQRASIEELRRFTDAASLPWLQATPVAQHAQSILNSEQGNVASGLDMLEATPTPVLVTSVPSPFVMPTTTAEDAAAAQVTASMTTTPTPASLAANITAAPTAAPVVMTLATNGAAAIPPPTVGATLFDLFGAPWVAGALGIALLALAVTLGVLIGGRQRDIRDRYDVRDERQQNAKSDSRQRSEQSDSRDQNMEGESRKRNQENDRF